MQIRGIIGALLTLIGVLWILHGVNVRHGSMMSGRGEYPALGAVMLVVGAATLAGARRKSGSHG